MSKKFFHPGKMGLRNKNNIAFFTTKTQHKNKFIFYDISVAVNQDCLNERLRSESQGSRVKRRNKDYGHCLGNFYAYITEA